MDDEHDEHDEHGEPDERAADPWASEEAPAPPPRFAIEPRTPAPEQAPLTAVRPRHELELEARALTEDADTTRVPRHRLFERHVEAGLAAIGRRDRRAREIIEDMLDECRNPKARVARLATLTERGRSLDDLVAAWELKQAWRDELEYDDGEGAGRGLSWEDALRILDAFDYYPGIDELVDLIASIAGDWSCAWERYRLARREYGWSFAGGLTRPPPFTRFLIESLHDHRYPLLPLRGRA